MEVVFDEMVLAGEFGPNGFGSYWRERVQEEETRDEVVEEDVVLPGDDDYEDERPWSNDDEVEEEVTVGHTFRGVTVGDYTHEQVLAESNGAYDRVSSKKRRNVSRVSYEGMGGDSDSDESDLSGDDSEEEEEEEEESQPSRKKGKTN